MQINLPNSNLLIDGDSKQILFFLLLINLQLITWRLTTYVKSTTVVKTAYCQNSSTVQKPNNCALTNTLQRKQQMKHWWSWLIIKMMSNMFYFHPPVVNKRHAALAFQSDILHRLLVLKNRMSSRKVGVHFVEIKRMSTRMLWLNTLEMQLVSL